MKTSSKKIIYFVLIILCCLFQESLKAQGISVSKLPSQILFNGYLTDKSGLPYNSNYNFTIYIYDSPDSKTPIYKETHENVIVKDGLFAISIGQQNNLSNLQFDKKYFIGIKLNDEEEMSQRLEFGSTAYSLGAKYANEVADGSISTGKIVNNSITDDKIKSFSINKIINLPASITSTEDLKKTYGLMGSDYEWWTTFGNLIYGPERHFLGTRNDRDFVIETNEIQRMRFDPYGYVLLGITEHPVDFEVFGFSTFDYVFVQGNLGVGTDPASAKMHINSPLGKNPLRVDYNNSSIFTIDTLGRVVITSSLSGNDTDINNYPLIVKGGNHGVGIDIVGSSSGDNNYVSFWDDSGMVGRIEGQTASEYAAQPQSITTDAFLVSLITAETVALVAWLYPLPIPAEPADIIRCAADIAEIVFCMEWDYTHLGITYESASGDYAEWLEREDINELISAGDIVAVNGGKITKVTTSAEQYMVISTSPIILGNMPEKGKDKQFNKVAFMGQIPVKVRGAVNNGDFIIPSGLNDGTGLAVAPELMTVEECDKIIGRAWSFSTNESVKLVNVYAGISTNDIGQLFNQMNSKKELLKDKENIVEQNISLLKEKLSGLKNIINKMGAKILKENNNSPVTSLRTESSLLK
jgi:hypothetical protein